MLLAFDLDQHLTANLAGFAVQCTPPNGPAAYLLNRLSFDTPITAATTPQARQWTPSNLAPFQKFRWKHFPADLEPGAYTYTVTAMYFGPAGSTQLTPGVSATISLELVPSQPQFQHFEMGVKKTIPSPLLTDKPARKVSSFRTGVCVVPDAYPRPNSKLTHHPAQKS